LQRASVGRAPHPVSGERHPAAKQSFDVTADGKKFLVNTGNLKEGSDPLTLVLNLTGELKKQSQGWESSVSFSPAVGYTGLRP
jgi:hypothetical protein